MTYAYDMSKKKWISLGTNKSVDIKPSDNKNRIKAENIDLYCLLNK